MADKRVGGPRAYSSGVALIDVIVKLLAHLPNDLRKFLRELLVKYIVQFLKGWEGQLNSTGLVEH